MTPKNVVLGTHCIIDDGVRLGIPSREYLEKPVLEIPNTEIGRRGVIRSGSVVYCEVKIGDNFQTGHNVLIREKTLIGDNVLIGTNSIIEGRSNIEKNSIIQSMVYIPINSKIEEGVFIGPNAVLTNDKYPPGPKKNLQGPKLRKNCTIGANATILPGIEIGEGALVAAGSIVTKNIPPKKLAIGIPSRIKDLPINRPLQF
jgi:acetyltransferase-like isoleucine patch superfamily enzyme